MIDYQLIKKAFNNNLPNTILIIGVFLSLNNKLNKMLVSEGIHDTKLEQLDTVSKEHKSIINRISKLETNFAAHIGDAYIREDDDE